MLAITLHLLAAVIWVGGMFFAYMSLRPVAATLFEPPVRLTMWCHVFSRFFPWVWISVVALLATGFWIIKIFGGMGAVGIHIHIMLLLGIIMILIFMHLFFSPYKKLKRAVTSEDWQAASAALNTIRHLIAINLSFGLIVVVIASGGRYL